MSAPASTSSDSTPRDQLATSVVDEIVEARAITWPSAPLPSLACTAALCISLALPLLVAGPGGPELAALAPSVLAAGLCARLIYQALGESSATRAVGVIAAATGAGVGVSLVVGFQLALGVAVAPIAALGAAGLALATVLVARVAARVEAKVGVSSVRVFFVGSPAQHRDLAREVGRHGGLSMAGWLPIERARDGQSLATAVAATRPSMLVVSAEAMEHDSLVRAASALHLGGLRVRALTDFYERHFRKVALSDLTRAWFLFDVAEIHRPRLYGRVKRGVEATAALALLVISAPLWPLIAIAIRRSGPGGLFYRQSRVGQDGKIFELVKFRTMRPQPTDVGAGWATDHLARITPIGRRLRRFRLDELPQLWLVVRGDLALVGPRPEQPAIVERLSESIEFYSARHRVRPGLSGWAQVNLGYGGSLQGAVEKLQYDFFYIKHQSLRLDARILFETARTVLSGGGH